jgi:hypothetical protein
MTDYRDPNYRDPVRPGSRGLGAPTKTTWSTTTWGWIAGISVAVLALIFAFGIGDRERTATDTSRSPETSGQRTLPLPPSGGVPSQAPSMNPAPPEPAPPAKQ